MARTVASCLVVALASAAGPAAHAAADAPALRVTVSALPSAVPIGRAAPYTIRVANVSDRTLPGVVLVHTVTGLARIVTATSTRGTCRGVPVTCEVGHLGRGESETVQVVALTEAEGPLTLRAIVTVADRGTATAASAEIAVLDAPGMLSVARYRPRLVLHWTHSGRGVTGFEIERKEAGRVTRIGRVAAHARRFEDPTARPGRPYVYRVRAVAGSAMSGYSTELIVTIAPRAAKHTDVMINPDLHKEQAEGERETVREATQHSDGQGAARPERTGATPAPEVPGHRQQGVTNRPLEEEEREQEQLPPRGQAKKPTPGGHG